MLTHKRDQRATVALAIAFFTTALVSFIGMRWNMQETQWSFPLGTRVMFLAAGLVSALVRLFGRTSVAAAIFTVAVAVPLGAFVAKLPQMIRDPTSNNLLIPGLIVLAVFALGVALAGALVGSLVLRVVSWGAHKGGDT